MQDPKAILTEQKLFYEKLYKSSNPRHEELHNELFLDNGNPFISKLSQAEVYSCEGKITLQECLGALKNMKQIKSLGLDGFTNVKGNYMPSKRRKRETFYENLASNHTSLI